MFSGLIRSIIAGALACMIGATGALAQQFDLLNTEPDAPLRRLLSSGPYCRPLRLLFANRARGACREYPFSGWLAQRMGRGPSAGPPRYCPSRLCLRQLRSGSESCDRYCADRVGHADKIERYQAFRALQTPASGGSGDGGFLRQGTVRSTSIAGAVPYAGAAI